MSFPKTSFLRSTARWSLAVHAHMLDACAAYPALSCCPAVLRSQRLCTLWFPHRLHSHRRVTTRRRCPADHWAVPGHASDAARHDFLKPAHRCPADHRAVLYWAVALYGVGNALRSAALVAYALDVLPPASRGVGIGLLRCAGDLGRVLPPMPAPV